MPGTNRRQVEDNAKAGRWIAGVRFSPRKPMHWRAGDVALALKLSPTTIPEPGSTDLEDRAYGSIRIAQSALLTLKHGIGSLAESDPDPRRRLSDDARIQVALSRLVQQTAVLAALLPASQGAD